MRFLGKFVGKIVVAVVVFGVLSAVGWWMSRDEPANAAVGDCLAGTSGDDMKVISCDDSTATYKVLGKEEEMTETEWDAAATNGTLCAAFPTWDITTDGTFWQGEAGETGTVLCLETL